MNGHVEQEEWQQFLAQCAQQAAWLEATVPKPGNVHPGASFDDLTYQDFVLSAAAAAPHLARTESLGVGAAIHAAVRATRAATPRNTNLGIILLIAPLAAVPQEQTLASGIEAVLTALTVEDAKEVYAAIRLAQPGGMGEVAEEDVTNSPQVTLREAMRLAQDRDTIAAQYAGRFELVLQEALPRLIEWQQETNDWDLSVIRLQLWLMANYPDTLIARKCGPHMAKKSAQRAGVALHYSLNNPQLTAPLRDLDTWLRADGHRRNPGTTADLIAATLFAGWRERMLPPLEKTEDRRLDAGE